MRTGDTASRDRQRLIRRPPDLLITTPESLYLMLTSSAAETLTGVETVIVDEIHALAPTKRGAHLSLSLERLEEVTIRPPQRIGLSATQRPLEEVARFLGGYVAPGEPRPVTIVDAGIRKPMEIEVVIPVEDMADLGKEVVPVEPRSGPADVALTPRRTSIWPSIYPKILDQVLEPSLDDHLLQRPPAGGAPRGQAQRARRGARHRCRSRHRPAARGARQGPPRLARPRAAGPRRGPAQAGRPARDRRHEQPRARHRHGRRRPRHPGRVPRRGQPWAAAHRAGRPPGGRAEPGHDLPEAPRRPPRGGRRHAADARRRDREHPLPAQPARRARPAARRPHRGARGDTCRRARRDGAPECQLRRPVHRAVRQHARPARRSIPERGVRRAAPPGRLEPGHRHGAGAGWFQAPRRDVRGDDSRPRSVRRLPP